MQIGEFAKICKTRISVLRHYDKEGLLVPDYIDRFTGYRYYAKEQIAVFMRITELKKAGFSLAEIRDILDKADDDADILLLFEKKRRELKEMLLNLENAKKMMSEVETMISVIFCESADGMQAKSSRLDANAFLKACETLESAIAAQGYQRISAYRSFGEQGSNEVEVNCDVVKLKDEAMHLEENVDLPFENDESLIGKWETVGEFAVKDDFYSGHFACEWYQSDAGIYFLPGGERYWCYGWTKDKLLIDNGSETSVNNFTTETYNGERYMFVDLKSYNYRHGGHTTVLVLRQCDHTAYSAEDLVRKDNIDMPFVDDPRVLGKWKAFDFCLSKKQFDPSKHKNDNWYFSEIEFKPDGEVISHYDFGKERIAGGEMQTWTKGYVLRKWNHSACAYEIRIIDDTEYLIMEWKSGDYRWGGFDTDYYVFVREG